MKFYGYDSIGWFRNAVRDVQDIAKSQGIEKLPILNVKATEKIHGMNVCVAMDSTGELFVQPRKNNITADADMQGCTKFVEDNKEAWKFIIKKLAPSNFEGIYIYFEWCGGNIQTKKAVSGLSKRAVIFSHYRIVKNGESKWITTRNVDSVDNLIFNINNFKTWNFEIDFNNPSVSKNFMKDIVENEIENNSPVGSAMGVEGNIGEGIVCTFTWLGRLYKFKIKGDKHSVTKVKKLKIVDEVLEQKKVDFANYATKAWRLEQCSEGLNFDDNKMIGILIKRVMTDVIKEESDILEEKGLTYKQVNPLIAKIVRTWFIEWL